MKSFFLHSRTYTARMQKYLLLPRVTPLHGSSSSFSQRMLHQNQVTASTEPQGMYVAVARQEGTRGGLAIGWQSPACRLCSPRSAEQSRFSLGIWHTMRVSPLPIRPPTHLHPSPIQTLLAINKQSKCQPAPGKSPRQLHPIQRAREQLPRAVPAQASHELGLGYGPGIPSATPPSQSSATLPCPQAAFSITPAPKASASTQDTLLAQVKASGSHLAPSFLTFLLWDFEGKLLIDTNTQFAQIPEVDWQKKIN